MPPSDGPGESVIERAFRVLDVLADVPSGIGLTEVATRSQLPKATAYRLLSQLAELQAVERRGQWYRLGPHIFRLGAMVTAQSRLREVALPFMHDLRDTTRQVVHLGVYDGEGVLVIEKAMSRRNNESRASLGTRWPLHCTALGKAIMVQLGPDELRVALTRPLARFTPHTIVSPRAIRVRLRQIRAAGWSVEREEWRPGFCCVAAPVDVPGGQMVAAVSVSGPARRYRLDLAATAVQSAAEGIARQLKAGSAASAN